MEVQPTVIDVKLLPETYVQNGVRLLDENRPGWWREIEPLSLDVSSASRCPLGQTYGFGKGIRALNIEELHLQIENGFESAPISYVEDLEERFQVRQADYANLTTLWRRVIVERQQEESLG